MTQDTALGPLRDLGTSGLRLSPVGIGTWAIGGAGWQGTWGDQADESSIAAIHEAVDQGVTWIDTAPVYGLGHSEVVVGDAVRKLSDDRRPLLFTKCGFQWAEDDRDDIQLSLTPELIRRECEQSLTRLGVDHIDLYQFHWPETDPDADGATPLEESWAAMASLVDEGKVRAIGVSNFDVAQLERCERVRHVDSVQPPFSMIGRKAADDVIPWALEHDAGVIAYSPMQSGLLTDKASVEWTQTFAAEDWRRTAPEFTSPRLERNLALRDRLRPIADAYGVSVAAVAVAWVLAVPGVTGAIVGARSPEQVRGWAAAGRIALSEQELSTIADAISTTRAGVDWSVYPNPRGE